MLAREGCALPVNLAEQHFARPADQRGFWVFPHRGDGEFTAWSYEDDGETANVPHGFWRLTVSSDAGTLRISVEREGMVAADGLELIFPAGEARAIIVTGGTAAEDRLSDGRRRLRLAAAG